MKKKGVMFTLIVIIFISVFLLSVSIPHSYNEREKSALVESRALSINKFIRDSERDIERGLYIASFRALIALNQEIIDSGEYSSDLASDFSELMVDGTLGSSPSTLMSGQELSLWMSKISEFGRENNIDVYYSVNEVELFQQNPWRIIVRINLSSNISDSRSDIGWVRWALINTSVSITNFEDPLYTIGSNNHLINTIRRTNVSSFTSGTDTTNLQIHNYNQFYIHSGSSPSFLMRMQGNFSNSECCGIESLVYLPRITHEDYIYNKSVVDYIYWSSSDPLTYTIQNMPSWFVLDDQDDHLELYQVDGLAS